MDLILWKNQLENSKYNIQINRDIPKNFSNKKFILKNENFTLAFLEAWGIFYLGESKLTKSELEKIKRNNPKITKYGIERY